MKFTRLLLCGVFGIVGLWSANGANAADPPVAWEVATGLKAPESAYLDPESGALFLSQIGEGGGTGKDGDGWISKFSADGKLVKDKWIVGLDSPKGLRSHQGTLWVSDIDQLVAIDIAKGEIVKRVKVEGAKFLNDVACGADGTVYVSDMPASRVMQYRDGKVSVFAEGPELECPNGLLVDGDQLLLGGWGVNIKEDFSTEKPGRLLALDLKTKKITPITPQPLGNLDGIERDGTGGYLVTDWKAGKVFHVAKDGKATLLLSLPQGTADHAYQIDQKRLILPRMMENKLTTYDVSKLLPKP
ncbi:MAG: SMP-30/gluconolactonase/LRE family protein [Pirellulales bacterium]